MVSRSVVLLLIASGFAHAQDNDMGPFSFCTEGGCQDCPVTLTSAGTGYPNCVIYNTNDVFPNHGYPVNSVGGGYEPFIDVGTPDPTCQIIIKTPANADELYCGNIKASFSQAACSSLTFEDTFMVQFCCGPGDCTAAGASGSKRSVASGGGLYLKDANGTTIPPALVAPVKTVTGRRSVGRPWAAPKLVKRAACDSNSWVADSGMEDYTRPADGAEIVAQNVEGGSDITITTERSTTYTQSLMVGLGFEDIVDIGVSFSVSEEVSTSKAYAFHVPEGSDGDVDFTGLLRCSTGTGTCSGGSLHGEICTGYKEPDGEPAGTYTVVVHS